MLEFRRTTEETVTWFVGQCISFGKHIPYSPIIDIVKQTFSVSESDSEVRITQRIEEGTSGWDRTTQATIPYIKVLLSVDPGDSSYLAVDPRERRASILDALRALLIEGSRHLPLIIVIEDIHWLDEQSEYALMALVDTIASLNVLLLLTYRPGYSHTLGERTYFDHLILTDLHPEQSASLARAILRESKLPDQLLSLITKKGEGNPLFIEEVIKSLLEAGILRGGKRVNSS